MRLSSGGFSCALRRGSHEPQMHLVPPGASMAGPDTAAPRDGTAGLMYLPSPSGPALSGLILKDIFILKG